MPGPRIYNLFPLLAGPVPQWSEHLERIAAMAFDWVFVNPFHYPGFSGSLYALSLGAPRAFGAVTPFGGAAFIAGWIALALGVARRREPGR